MVTMYKRDRKFRKWKWVISPSRFFDVFIVDANGGRHHVQTHVYRHRAQEHKRRIEANGGTAIIIGRV